MSSAELSPEDQYVLTALQVALSNVRGDIERHDLGPLQYWEITFSEQSGWLFSVVVRSRRHGGALVRHRRSLLPPWGPDKDPETSGIIYSSNFVEQMLTRKIDPTAAESEPIDL